jgi:putative spermidine/putrescine transport system permease protein
VGTSLVIALSVAVLATVVGSAAGRALGLYAFPGRRAVQLLLLAPVLVPTFAVTLGIQVFFIRYGLADTVAGVVLVQLIPTVPYAGW